MTALLYLIVFWMSAICCRGQDFTVYPTNPPGIKVPSKTTPPSTASPPVVAPINITAEQPASTSNPTTSAPSQPVVDDHNPSIFSLNALPFILLLGGGTIAVIVFLAMRLHRRKRKFIDGRNDHHEVQQNPVNETMEPDTQCKRHHSCESHGSARTVGSSVDSMVYLDAYEWRATPMRAQAQVGRSIPQCQPRPQSAACESKPILHDERTCSNYPTIQCESPVGFDTNKASSFDIECSAAHWSVGATQFIGLGHDDDSACDFDEIVPSRTSYLTDSMLVLVPEEL